MRGLICGIKRMEIHDGEGIRTTVFFKGCPLKCIWCHNPESISFKKQIAYFSQKCISCGACNGERNELTATACPTDAQHLYGEEYETDALAKILLADKPFFENSGGGVTLSGGECLAQGEFAIELAKKLKKNGIGVYIDTCGFVNPEIFERIIPYTEKFLYDIKAMDPVLHKKLTGQDNYLILNNLKLLSDRGCDIEVRYPLVMGYNDREAEKIGLLLSGLQGVRKIKVLQYHSFAASRYSALQMECTMPNTKTEREDVQRAVDILASTQEEITLPLFINSDALPS